ncbi:hypothetical protein K0M31_018600 [Melipona bicolor]|uniref:Uncharacterized protein n=1 Tax=Melipona bicolor TaxID=60889 RepID=A0AA40G4C8_9HYME|nr:hypothetical protein K0M31_018600 [Melipona bicolor]
MSDSNLSARFVMTQGSGSKDDRGRINSVKGGFIAYTVEEDKHEGRPLRENIDMNRFCETTGAALEGEDSEYRVSLSRRTSWKSMMAGTFHWQKFDRFHQRAQSRIVNRCVV